MTLPLPCSNLPFDFFSGLAVTLAIFVQQHLLEMTGRDNGGVRTGNFHMVRNTDMPAVLCELGFITNPKQEQWLQHTENQHKLSETIARGACDFYAREFKRGEDDDMSSDVDKKRWSYRDIMAMAALKIKTGYPSGTFKPNQPVTWGRVGSCTK